MKWSKQGNGAPTNWFSQSSVYPIKIHVFAAVCGNGNLFGPYFIEGGLTSQKYINMLREEVIPNIRDKLGEEEFSKMWFQQDGVRPHCTRAAMDYLHSVSSNRLITLNSAQVRGTDWPLTSPDLSTLDYHTWKSIQEKLYFGPNPPHDLVSLKSCEPDWSSISSSHSRARNIRQRASQPAGQTAPHPPVYLPVAVMFFSEAVNSLPTSAAILDIVSSSRY